MVVDEVYRWFKLATFPESTPHGIIYKWRMHDEDGALDIIRNAVQSLREIGMEIGMPMFTAIEAEMHLRRGDLAFAMKWASEMGFESSDMRGILDERQYFTYARILIAEGKNQKALTVLERLGEMAKAGDRFYRLITVHILNAVAFTKMHLPEPSVISLRKAIELAAPEGCFRLFLDEDPCILPMLGKVRSLAPEFVDLLAEKYRREDAAGKPAVGERTSNYALSGPLSGRELEVLELVAAGLSNREIADRLFISLGTTKWHITNILSKLGVRSRVQAVKAAESILTQKPYLRT